MTRVKRAFLLLMTLLLPLQSAWAGSDVDCQSSLLVPCSHDAASVSPDASLNTQPGTHLDDSCVCHLGHVDVMLSNFSIACSEANHPVQVKGLLRMTSHLTPPPERPQWA